MSNQRVFAGWKSKERILSKLLGIEAKEWMLRSFRFGTLAAFVSRVTGDPDVRSKYNQARRLCHCRGVKKFSGNGRLSLEPRVLAPPMQKDTASPLALTRSIA
jgi:hypothetical protein